MFTIRECDRLGVELEVRASGAQGYVLESQAAPDLIRASGHLLAGIPFGASPAAGEAKEI